MRICLLCAGALAVTMPPVLPAAESLDAVQRTAVETARIRAETVRLRHESEAERKLLEGTAAALRDRVRTLEETLRLAQAESATARRETETAAARSETLTSQVAAADGRARALGEELARLQPWLPPRLARALERPLQSLASASLPPAERAQLLASVLNRCLQFNSAIIPAEEVLPVASGGERLFDVFYLGLAQGYAFDRASGEAFVGRPGRDGWEWTPRREAAAAIAAALAVLRDDADPEFATLPARLASLPASTAAAR